MTLRRIAPLLPVLLLAASVCPVCNLMGYKPAPAFDWAAFLARHDFVWQTMPDTWGESAFIGNGNLGATIFLQEDLAAAGSKQLSWEINRADLYVALSRIPVGRVALKTAGAVTGGDMRLDLWNAEARGTLRTARGGVRWRSVALREPGLILIEAEGVGGEPPPGIEWHAALVRPPRSTYKQQPYRPDELHPPAVVTATDDGGFVSEQTYLGATSTSAPGALAVGDNDFGAVPSAGASVAAARALRPADAGGRRVFLVALEHAADLSAARARAEAVLAASATEPAALLAAHRAWWRAYYPRSRVELPGAPALETFYWRQIYKLGAAMRADGPICDLLGPWYRVTAWPRIWWNLNLQLTYHPLAASNRLDLAESLYRNLDRRRDQLIANALPARPERDTAAIGRTSVQDLRSFVRTDRPTGAELGNLPWMLYHYWEFYRVQMDDAILRDRLLPLLAPAVNYYLGHTQTEADGLLHLRLTHSPEFADATDANYDLALLRWGLQTLVDSHGHLHLDDKNLPRWRDALARLAPFPVDEKTGLLIGRDRPLDKAHRHFSHLMSIYPLHLLDLDDPARRALATRSINHWLAVPGDDRCGFTYTGAASLLAMLGDGDGALGQLNQFFNFSFGKSTPDTIFLTTIFPNTFYAEESRRPGGSGGLTIETPLTVVAAVNDMLLQSHGGLLRVFPAMPAAWPDARFENLRAEGAFLVSGEWRGGRAVRVEIKSLAGEPCRLRVPGWTVRNTRATATAADGVALASEITALPNGGLEIILPKNATLTLAPANSP